MERIARHAWSIFSTKSGTPAGCQEKEAFGLTRGIARCARSTPVYLTCTPPGCLDSNLCRVSRSSISIMFSVSFLTQYCPIKHSPSLTVYVAFPSLSDPRILSFDAAPTMEKPSYLKVFGGDGLMGGAGGNTPPSDFVSPIVRI